MINELGSTARDADLRRDPSHPGRSQSLLGKGGREYSVFLAALVQCHLEFSCEPMTERFSFRGLPKSVQFQMSGF